MKIATGLGVVAVVGGTLVGGRAASCVPTPATPARLDAGPPEAGIVIDSEGGSPDAGAALVDAGPCDFVGPRTARSGAKRSQPRIVGGTTASEGRYPFAVAIATATRFQYCGGTLVGPRHVLTAAHCQVAEGDLALVGSVSLYSTRAVRVVESRIHRAFDAATMDYDVAVAVLAEGIAEDVLLRAADPSPPIPIAGDATTIGWGATREGGPTSSFLQQVDVPLWSADDCRRVYPSLTTRQVCAGRVGGGADSCQGDSGGALLSMVGGSWRQLGIVSYGTGCARAGVPGVYTDLRAPEIRIWIAACATR